MNKLKLFDFLKEKQLGNCDYYLVNSWEKFDKKIKQLGFPNKPVCFKPVQAWGSRGFRIIDPTINFYRLFMDEKPNSTYIPQGQTHRLANPGSTPLEIIEVQSGSYLGEDDIVRFEDAYGRGNEI